LKKEAALPTKAYAGWASLTNMSAAFFTESDAGSMFWKFPTNLIPNSTGA